MFVKRPGWDPHVDFPRGKVRTPVRDIFIYTFADADGTPIDLAGFTGRVTWLRHSTGEEGDFPASAVTGPTVEFSLPEALSATPDVIDVQVWAGDGICRLDGLPWRIIVADGPGTAPAI